MKIGEHQSIAGGHKNALFSIHERGGNCLQIFSSSPRSWRKNIVSDEQAAEFVEIKNNFKIDPIYFHAMYLLNLAESGQMGKMSVQTIVDDLVLAEKMQIKGIVVHLGTFKKLTTNRHPGRVQDLSTLRDSGEVAASQNDAFKTLITNIQSVLENTPESTYLMIENAGYRKIGTELTEIATILQTINSPRLKVCLDTCHLYVAGYDFTTPDKLENLLQTIEETITLEKVEMFHANDAKGTYGSFLDRHENIGEGTIGKAAFKLLLNHPKTKQKPFILEVPGFDDKGPDKANIDILKSLVG